MKNTLVKFGLAALSVLLLGSAFVGCSGEEAVTEGDAPIIKDTPKNENPPAKAIREKLGANPGGAVGSGTVEPPAGK